MLVTHDRRWQCRVAAGCRGRKGYCYSGIIFWTKVAVRIHNEPPNNCEPKPGEQEVEGEHKKSPSPLCVYKRSEYVLQVASPSLGHVPLHHFAVSVLEHDPFPYSPRTEAGLPVPADIRNIIDMRGSHSHVAEVLRLRGRSTVLTDK
jgi:hypothetical protein